MYYIKLYCTTLHYNYLEHILEYSSSSSDEDNNPHPVDICDNPQPMDEDFSERASQCDNPKPIDGTMGVCVMRCGCCKGCENLRRIRSMYTFCDISSDEDTDTGEYGTSEEEF